MPSIRDFFVEPTDGVLFPAFMVGDRSTCRRRLKAEAKRWAKAYLAGCEFPEPTLVGIHAGSIVFTEDSTADLIGLGYNFIPDTDAVIIDGKAAKENKLHIQCRVFTLSDLEHETGAVTAKERTFAEGETFRQAFRTFACKFAWGALGMAILMSLHNGVPATVQRIEAVLRHWETLDTLRYIDLRPTPVSFSQLMQLYFKGQIGLWVDQPTGDVRADLQTALERMRQASVDEIDKRLIGRLRELIDVDPRLKHRDWLRSPGVIEMALKQERQTGQVWYDNLTSKDNDGLGGFLFWLEHHYGPDSEKYDPSFGKAALT